MASESGRAPAFLKVVLFLFVVWLAVEWLSIRVLSTPDTGEFRHVPSGPAADPAKKSAGHPPAP